MNYAIKTIIWVSLCAALTFGGLGIAIGQDSEESDVRQDSEDSDVRQDSEDSDVSHNPEQSGDDSLEELELISIDELPASREGNVDEIGEILVPQPSERQSDLEDLRRSFELYKFAVANGTYEEADTLAKRMVELSIRIFGLDSHESAKALTNLGLVQRKKHEYESAVLNFTAAIDIIERIEDRLNSELINPLRGLGSAQLGAGRPDLARKTFDRAVHVSHVNEGPHNLMQIDMLEDLAETYLTMGDSDEALDVHEHIYMLESRNTDLKSEDIIPALERQAEWLNRMRMFDKERMTWRRVIDILEDSRGKEDLSLVPPLLALGNSYLYVPDYELEIHTESVAASGDTYLKRAIRITQDNPDATWDSQLKSILALGDFYVLTLRSNKAKRVYQAAWKLLSEDKNLSEEELRERMTARATVLEESHILQAINPPKYYNSDQRDNGQEVPDSFEVGTVVVAYAISTRGITKDTVVVEADPPGLDDMEYSVEREVRRLLHRPRMENGVLVRTPDQTYTHEFYFRPSDLPAQEKDQTDAVADESVASEES